MRKESGAPGYADPSGTDFAPESSAVCFRFHCRSIDLQYLEETVPLLGFSNAKLDDWLEEEFGKTREGGRDRRRPGFPDPDFTPPSPPFHVSHSVLYTKYTSKACSSVVGGREKRARAFSRVSCAARLRAVAKHTRQEREASLRRPENPPRSVSVFIVDL